MEDDGRDHLVHRTCSLRNRASPQGRTIISDAKPLPFGPIGPRCFHLCVDMQKVFAEDTSWHTPWMGRIRPLVARLGEYRPERTIFTRFLPPERPEAMRGTWRRYYKRWSDVVQNWQERGIFDLLPEFAALVPPGRVLDKLTYSPWVEPTLAQLLEAEKSDTLIISGAETDVCVLAAVLGAVDRGYRVIIPSDAICSSSDRTHDALMQLYHERFGQQIETASAEEIIAAWR